jgi:hypothetical protein
MTKDRVLNSVNNEHADRCVDFIVRPDGTHGFKEFRRDPEDPRGWYLTAFDPSGVYSSYDEAVTAAQAQVAWLREAIERSPPFVP